MEILCLYRANGEQVLTLDLSGKASALTVGSSPVADISLAAYIRPEDALIAPIAAALVHDEDGWSLATADPAYPLSLGTASVLEARLSPGVTCGLGDFLFRIDGETVVRSAVMLLWTWKAFKGTRSAPLLEGNNLVACLPGSEVPELNPAVVGRLDFRIVLEDNALTILMPEREGMASEWLRVGMGEGFSVGDFTGVALPTSEAEKALKSRRPLAWPGRPIRERLGLYLFCGILIALLMLMVAHKTRELREAIAIRDSQSRERPATCQVVTSEVSTLGDDVRVYDLDFHRSLPTLLKAERQPHSDFLIARGAALQTRAHAEANTAIEERLARKLVLLCSIRAIKEAVGALHWQELRDVVADVDRAAFDYYDATSFIDDAQELSCFVTETLPSLYAATSLSGVEAFNVADRNLNEGMEGLRDNRFATEAIAEPLQALALQRWAALRVYIHARAAFQANPTDATAIETVLDAFSTLEDLFEDETSAVVQLIERERKSLNDIACASLRSRLTEPTTLSSADEMILRELAHFLRAIGGDTAVAQEAMQAAETLAHNAARRWRALHATYRLQRIANSPKATETLQEMLLLGPSDNSFYLWAVRERDRLRTQTPSSPELPTHP